MIRFFAIALAVIAFTVPAFAQEPNPKDKDKDLPPGGIEFPSLIVPPLPQPVQVTRLTEGQLYVITSDIPCYVLASPEGLVSITEEAGPLRIRGLFVDGTKIQTRTYRQKQIFLVESTGTGTVELLVVVVGKTKAADVLRKTLLVNAPPGPDPPGPGPGPDPKPPTPPTPDAELVKVLQAAFAKDTDTDKATRVTQLAAVYRQAAKVTAPDATFTTVKQIDEAVRTAAQGILGVLAIPNTRDAVGVWLRSQLPTAAATPLDDQLRQKYVAAWTALAIALEKVK